MTKKGNSIRQWLLCPFQQAAVVACCCCAAFVICCCFITGSGRNLAVVIPVVAAFHFVGDVSMHRQFLLCNPNIHQQQTTAIHQKRITVVWGNCQMQQQPQSEILHCNTKRKLRSTTALFTSTIQQSLPQKLSSSTSMKTRIGSRSSSRDRVNTSLLSNNRTIAETTWQLFNGTEIGFWDRTDFEMMEYIVDTLCSQSSSSVSSSPSPYKPQKQQQQQSRQQQQEIRLQQNQYKRTALLIERFLYRIIQEQMMENPFGDCVDMTALYTNLIHAWASCGEMGSQERAEEILDYFQTIYEEGDSYDPLLCGPTISSFNAVIGAYALSGRTDAPQQSIRVLTKLYEMNKSGRTMAAPNQESFAHILRAWGKMATAESPELVRRTLVHLDALAASYPSVKPDCNCHNEYYYALTESVTYRKISGIDAAQLAETYLYKMLESIDERVRPDKWSFAMVLSLLCRSNAPNIVPRAEAVMTKLEQYHEQSGHSEKTQPNTNAYNSLMTCYARQGNSETAQKAINLLYKMKKIGTTDNPSAQPNAISFNVAMDVFVKSGRKDAPLKVEALLNEMFELYNATGDVRILPNLRSLNICLDAWSKSSNDDADEQILGWIYRVRNETKFSPVKIIPDIWSYTHYLRALARSGRPRMGDEAERVLNEVEHLYRGGYHGLKPNVLIFTSAIHCIALSGQGDSVERALAILDRMEDLHAEGFGDVRPNLFTYNCVINTIAKSKRRNKAELAMQTLRRIQSVALRPGCISFNNVINACAFSNHPDDDGESILQIALDVLKEAQDGPGANWITYQGTIRVICSFVSDPAKRWQLTREIFNRCCDDGQLTRTVMTQIRFAVTEAQYSMLEDKATFHSSLSPSGNHNVSTTTTSGTKELLDKYTINARRSFLEGTTTVFRV